MGLINVDKGKDSAYELIQRRRYQILVHSLIYYELDYNIISDSKWTEWARELVRLQNKYPEQSKQVIFYEQFKDFEGASGYNLPFRDQQIVNIAYRLLKMEPKSAEVEMALEKLKYRVIVTPAIYDKYKKNSGVKYQKPIKEVKPVAKKQFKGLLFKTRK